MLVTPRALSAVPLRRALTLLRTHGAAARARYLAARLAPGGGGVAFVPPSVVVRHTAYSLLLPPLVSSDLKPKLHGGPVHDSRLGGLN